MLLKHQRDGSFRLIQYHCRRRIVVELVPVIQIANERQEETLPPAQTGYHTGMPEHRMIGEKGQPARTARFISQTVAFDPPEYDRRRAGT